MDKTLADYIKRTTEQLKKDNQESKPPTHEHNDYEIYPEQQGEEDRPQNPYSRV